MNEPMELLVDGNNHGHYSIDCFIDRYIDLAKFYRQVPECRIDLQEHSFWLERHNEQFREYAHEVDECISAGEVSIIHKGIEWRVEWRDGDIWAVHPDSTWCDQCDTYHTGPCYVELEQMIEALVEANVEYVETHTDSGNAYLECISECYFDDRLVIFISDNEIDTKGMEVEEVSRLLVDHLEPVSGHYFGRAPSDIFVANEWHLQEIKTQIELSELDVTPEQFLEFSKQSEHCIRYTEGANHFAVYVASDAVWQAQIDVATIQELINDEIERTREQF